MPHAVCEIHLTPIGTNSTSLSRYIAAAENVLKNFPNVQSQLHPMATTLEGELDELFQVIRQMHEAPFGLGALRVSTTVRFDDRRDGSAHSMNDRVASVQNKPNQT